MDTQNTLITPENLIEELEDEALATCVGGCGWHWKDKEGLTFQGDLELDDDGKKYKFTAYWIDDKGSLKDKKFKCDLDELDKKGIYFDSSPTGSARFWSDRTIKEAFTEVDAQQVLEKVAALPITTWKYTQEADSVRHIGPMAQDFAATFGVGDSDRSIHAVDANGVALAAIQGLYQKLVEKGDAIAALHQELNSLKQQVA